MKNSKYLLLLNVGTPDSPDKKDVKKYLKEFLNDERVIDLHWLPRKILVNGIIVPFRLNTSVSIYQQLWKNHGRALSDITERLKQKLQESKLGREFDIDYAMRYGNPSVESKIRKIVDKNYDEILLLPLFPHHAMSTTETVVVEAMYWIEKLNINAKIKTIPTFFDNQQYIESIVRNSNSYNLEEYDHILFSYHGLPNRHIRKAHKDINYKTNKFCDGVYEPAHRGCYNAECYETTRLLAKALKLHKEQYSIAFQSRLTSSWLKPFADKKIISLARNGAKKIIVFTPSFTIDCLETLNEIGEEYSTLFYDEGGQQLDLVPCLNDSDAMIDLITKLCYR